MTKSRWTLTAAVSAALLGAVAALVAGPAAPAHSDEGDEDAHTPPADFAKITEALDNWDDDDAREAALAEYLGFASRDEAFAPLEDPTYFDNR
jgi:hypothetical protein